MDNLRELIEKGKAQGFISQLELQKYLPPDVIEPEQLEDIVVMLKDMGIEVRKEKAEVFQLNSKDEN